MAQGLKNHMAKQSRHNDPRVKKPPRDTQPQRNVNRSNEGWIVRIMRQGTIHQRYFADGIHGGQALALDAANAYSAWLRESLRSSATSAATRLRGNTTMPAPSIGKPRKIGPSGVVGVTRATHRDASGNTTDCWVAEWPPTHPGCIKRRSFAIRRYGEAEALALAIEARQAAMQALEMGNIEPERAVAWMHLQLPLGEEHAEQLQGLARARGVSCSALVAEFARAALKRESNRRRAASKAGTKRA